LRNATESVDLIYLDPPFNSQQDYNVIYRDKTGKRSEAQKTAFEDTWEWGNVAAAAYQDVVRAGGQVGRTVEALYKVLGDSDMMAYLCMMAPRLVELHRVLKPTGSLYLHCDPGASHYLKVLLDAAFGPGTFRNEVIWCYRKWSVSAGQFARNHDVLLFYTKAAGKGHVFIPQFVPVKLRGLKPAASDWRHARTVLCLLTNVPPDHLLLRGTHRFGKVAVRPEPTLPRPLLQLRELPS
jgi:site-specific DNA-methyltransferase (adenine-specific)